MKRILPLLSILIVIFSSCQKELQFGDGSTGNNGGTDSTTNNNNGGSSSAVCKSCAYYPTCDGSQYTFNDTVSGVASVRTITVKVVKDTTIGGKPFQKLYNQASSNYEYYNCTDGVTRIISYNPITVNGNSVLIIDLRFVNANQPVNTTWTDKITNPAGQEVDYVSTIKAKGISRTVNGKIFTDVIYVQIETGLNAPILGYIKTNVTDYYYAKGVGTIEATLSDASGTVLQHSALKSYNIP